MVTGLTLYDASGHALALVSTGGFSPNAASIGAYDSVAVELVLIIGMIIGGASFTLHYQFLRGRGRLPHATPSSASTCSESWQRPVVVAAAVGT